MSGTPRLQPHSLQLFGPDAEGKLGRIVKVDVTNDSARFVRLLRFSIQYSNASGVVAHDLRDMDEVVEVAPGETVTVLADEGPGLEAIRFGPLGSAVTARVRLVAFESDAADSPAFEAVCSATAIPEAAPAKGEDGPEWEFAWDDGDEPETPVEQAGLETGGATLFRVRIARIRPDFVIGLHGDELSLWDRERARFVDPAGMPTSNALVTIEVFRRGSEWILYADFPHEIVSVYEGMTLPSLPKRYAGRTFPPTLDSDIFDILEETMTVATDEPVVEAIRASISESFHTSDGPTGEMIAGRLDSAGVTFVGHEGSDTLQFEPNEANRFAGGLLFDASFNTDFPFEIMPNGIARFDGLDEGDRRQFIYACQSTIEGPAASVDQDMAEPEDPLSDDERDPLFGEAVDVCIQQQAGSTAALHNALGVGYGRAARLIEQLEEAGILGPADGSKPRALLVGVRSEDAVVAAAPRVMAPAAVPLTPAPTRTRAPRLAVVGPMLLVLAAGFYFLRPWARTPDVAVQSPLVGSDSLAAAPPIAAKVDPASLFPAQPSGYVTDVANLLDAETAAAIEVRLDSLQRLSGAEVVVVTLTTIGEQSLQSVATAVITAWAVGTKVPVGTARRDLGVVLLLVPTAGGDRGPVWIEAGSRARELLGETALRELRDAMAPALQGRRYGEALDIGSRMLVERLSPVSAAADSVGGNNQ